jgi:hypothetical protein
MEPISHTTYYEDVYTRPKREEHDDHVEAGGRFDLCEDSSDDETDDEPSRPTKKNLKHSTLYGTIKKPTCKAIPCPATYPYKGADSTILQTSRERK